MAERFQVGAVLKADSFGRVERIDALGALGAHGRDAARDLASAPGDSQSGPRELHTPVAIRRVACGSGSWFSGLIARRLLERERAALRHLAGLEGVPREEPRTEWLALASRDGRPPRANEVLVRSWMAGAPLHEARVLPRDFFDHLDALVHALHARGVCHNDLHKEQNILVAPDGRPQLVDFQLASVHATRGRSFAVRAREDLRHVEKHRRRYTRWGRGPDGAHEPQAGAGAQYKRSPLALVWRRTGKPIYNGITRGLLRTRDGEARRPSSGPWPSWSAPLGPPRS